MSENSIILSENLAIEPKIYNGQKVVTFKDIDTAHQRPAGTANRNFHSHKNFFVIDEDYYYLTGSEITKIQGSTNFVEPKLTRIILFTESGYLLLTKPLTDELSWNIQKILVKNYFRAKEEPKTGLTFNGQPCVMAFDLPQKYDRSKGLIYKFINTKLNPL